MELYNIYTLSCTLPSVSRVSSKLGFRVLIQSSSNLLIFKTVSHRNSSHYRQDFPATMMYGDPQQHHNQQQPGGGGDHFNRGPQPPQPPGPPMMRQPSASSSTLNPPEFHHLSSNPPYDGNSFNSLQI